MNQAQDLEVRSRQTAPIGIAVGVLAVVAVLAVPLATTLLLGVEPYEQIARIHPGTLVAVAATLLRAGAEIGGVLSIGALVYMLFLRDGRARDVVDLGDSLELAILRHASSIWMLCAAGLMLFDPLDSTGVELVQLWMPGAIEYVQTAAYAPGAVMIRFLGATAVALSARFVRRWTHLLVPLWAAVLAVLAPVVVGHVLVGPAHDLGGDAAAIQTVATHLLFGALAVAAIRAWSGREISRGLLHRLFLVGAVAIPVIVVLDVVIAVFLLAGTGLLESLTGWFIVARWIFLGVLVAVGLVVSRWRASARAGTAEDGSALDQGHIRALLTVAAIGIAGWFAVGVAMTREPTPQYFVPTSITQIFLGFDIDAAPTAAVLFSHWRLNLLIAAIAVAAVAAYLVALRTARRRGVEWPIGRTIAWIVGWGLTVFATSSGFGKYSAPHFGIHMIVHMTLSMMAPVLMVLGGFVTLLLRANRADGAQHGLHNWITWVLNWRVVKFLYNPLLVFVLFIGSYYGLYFTNLFGDFVRFHWAHQLMNLHFLLVGYLYYGLVVGIDRAPRPLPHLGRLGLVMAAMPFHAFFGVILMGSKRIIAEDFYVYIFQPWMDLEAAQYMGGGVAWAGGEIPALIVIIVLGIQWARQDAKDATRIDRHIDSGRDSEFEEYNRMLQRLSQRQPTAPVAPAREEDPS